MVIVIGKKRNERDPHDNPSFFDFDRAMQGKGEDDGIYRAHIPKFLYQPAIGYPRNINIPKIRQLGRSSYVSIVKDTILSNVENIEWEIRPKKGYKYEDEKGDDTPVKYTDIERTREFLERPNYDKGTFSSVFVRQLGDDILDLDSGVLIKIFNRRKKLVAVQSKDGGSFVKNPDIYGTYRNRADFFGELGEVVEDNKVVNPATQVPFTQARNRGAYFQFIGGGNFIVPFGKKEIAWVSKNEKTYDIYGYSPIIGIYEILDYLLNSTRADLDYFYKNNIPKGAIFLEGATSSEVKNFKQQFNNQIYHRNELGEVTRMHYEVPIINRPVHFKNFEFNSQELETLEKQKWYSKLVWAQFGITPSEIGFTEDAKGQANQIIQSKTGRRRAILPMCKAIEEAINREILPDLGVEGLEFKFKTSDLDNEKSRVELRRQELEAGLKTINEARADEGLEPLPDGDRLIIDNEAQGYEEGDERDLDKENQNKENNLKAKKEESDTEKILSQTEPAYEHEPEELEQGSARLQAYIDDITGTIEAHLSESEERVTKLLERELETLKPLDTIQKSYIDIHERAIEEIDSPEALERAVRENLSEVIRLAEESASEHLGIPLRRNKEAQEFLQTYTFDLIKGMRDEIVGDLRAELQRGLMNGEGTGELKERVRSAFKTKEYRARMIANTEVTRANNYGRLQAYNRSGREIYKYIQIVDDHRTSEVSYAMDRKYGDPKRAIPIRQEFSVWVHGKKYHGQAPPFMPNDRDTVIFITEEEKKIPEEE